MGKEESMRDDFDLGSFVPPDKPKVVAGVQQSAYTMRGVGDIHRREPIAAWIEVMKRGRQQDGTWKFIRPFTKDFSQDASFGFHVLNPVPTTYIQRGTSKVPAREGHPQFEAFNTCDPKLSRVIKCRIIHWKEEDCFRKFLGAYQPPVGGKVPDGSWWCRGDAKRAIRYVNGEKKEITCPNRMCEYMQDNFGPQKNMPHCKPHMSIIAQFDMPDNSLPKVVFQWDSQSWNNVANAEAMFGLIQSTARNLGYKDNFPVFGLPFIMVIKERVKGQRKFPEVSFSIDGDMMDWMQKVREHSMMVRGQQSELPLAEEPKQLGYTQKDIDVATEASLNPNYRPANERKNNV